ncbi:tol-pal system protein YbgF [Luteitalea pratensis]|uniref:Tol-pal system protein YbgF n=1 Tax=Luteitalea pratensis TaxID=1855912 RepID=A0A143PRK3_LUTPR|nr:Wzy polymerase domain-containing protein [Luteitalea pratensis]AMY10449.1 tol-pal system protein YbgF [Luteitalea pratensis]
MNKTEREQLKHNEAVDALVSANTYLSPHGRTLGLAAVAVLLLVGSVFGYRAFKARSEERAHRQLAAAVEILNAPVATAPTPGAPPVGAAPGTYATEAARAGAALKQLLSTADAYKGTDAGMRARYYAASLYAETNRPKEAGDAYAAVRDQAGASTLLGRMASLGLASMQVRQKQFDPAIKALQELAQRRDGPLPVDAVLVQLADAYQQAGRSAEASQTLQRVIDEFPQSPYAADARQRVEALQVSAPKAS